MTETLTCRNSNSICAGLKHHVGWQGLRSLQNDLSAGKKITFVISSLSRFWLLAEANGQIMSATLFRLVDGLKSILWNLCHCKYIVHLSDIQKAFCPC